MSLVDEFLESEVIEKSRAVLYSNLLSRFASEQQVDYGVKSFVGKSGEKVKVLVVVTTISESDGSIKMSLKEIGGNEFSGDPLPCFGLWPLTSQESASAVWKREMADVRKEIVSARPGLWQPKHALVVAESEERRISIHHPSQVVAKPPPAATKPEKSVSQPVKAAKKFEVPLDKLDAPDEKMSMEKENEDSSQSQQGAPEVALTIASSSSGVVEEEVVVPPEVKRQRMMPDDQAHENVPEFREVTIKKKVVVTEYGMGPNGEMIVRDVEKMVEETKLEKVVATRAVVTKSVDKKSEVKKPPPKGAAAGQGTLTSFFKSKN